MPTEIERKFLVINDDWRQHVTTTTVYRQGYLCNNESVSVRVRVSSGSARLNIKSAERSSSRTEFEFDIDAADAQHMLDQLCVGPLVEKTRFVAPHQGHDWEVDVFSGDNEGLVVAEVELSRVDEVFELPVWAGEEVTDDLRYYNVSLSTRPFNTW